MRVLAAALALSLSAATGAGCASPGEIRQGGNAHLARAKEYEAQGDQVRAAKERAAATKQFTKANRRAYNEATLGIYRY
jgi:hypothetical protein